MLELERFVICLIVIHLIDRHVKVILYLLHDAMPSNAVVGRGGLRICPNTHRVGYDASSRMLSSPHPKICYPFAIYCCPLADN